MSSRAQNAARTLAAILFALAGPVAMAVYGHVTDTYLRYWLYLGAFAVLAISAPLGWLFFGTGRFRDRFKGVAVYGLVLALAIAAFRSLTRYEGSTSGTSLPKFVWRWTPEASAAADPAPLASPAPSAPVPVEETPAEGAVDVLDFLGPGRDGMWSDAELSASFDWENAPPEELWRIPVGLGWSSFVVKGRRAVTQEQRGDAELVTCYDLLTGAPLWAHSDPGTRFVDAIAHEHGAAKMGGDGPRATPTIHGDRVFAHGATGHLNCLKLNTGELVWSREVLGEGTTLIPKWGKSDSPLVLEKEGLVVVSGPESAAPTLAAFVMETGEPAWEYPGAGSSYSTPRLADLHGVRQILSVNAGDLTGNDPATGAALWRFPWRGANPKVGQPIDLPGDRVLVTASYGAGSYLVQIDRDAGQWTATAAWKSLRLKTKFSSAVVRGDHLYAFDEGRLACVEVATGNRVWKGGDYGFGQQLLVGDRLLVQAEDGRVALVNASPDSLIETASLDALHSLTWNVPALAGRYLLVRNDREAVCYRLAGKR
ncbi:MAG: PQQ-binding-like beta-propeller repeat protein [Akkermansiaceae bacterium]|nr:PQQ-binding-like beta-propeller repeat protein [Akkermansiaceae bacterium]MCP5549898.1 PQQ-binding-like beta-propeller repeat protein [Akkermansiaceae bacterium]